MVLTAGCARSLALVLLLQGNGLSSAVGLNRPVRHEHGHADTTGRLQTLDRALLEMNEKHHQRVCLTIKEPDEGLMGGLANGVGFVNSAYEFALRSGTHFIFPKLKTKEHDDGSDYSRIFGVTSDRTCEVQKYEVVCDKLQRTDTEAPAGWLERNGGKKRCDLSQYVVDMANSTRVHAQACGCEALVIVNPAHMQWHFDYSRTHSALRRMYWQGQELQTIEHQEPGPPSTACHRNVALHIRLGDVARNRTTCKVCMEKYIVPDTYITMLRSLKAVVPPACLRLSIITDGEEGDLEPQAVVKGAKKLGLRHPIVLDKSTLAQDAFAALTHADILVCGGSGFCRLAAVLAKDEAARVCIQTKSHPVDFLPNVTELQLPGSTADRNMTDDEAATALGRNPAILSMASQAENYLWRQRVIRSLTIPWR